jgi:hypothetical protein
MKLETRGKYPGVKVHLDPDEVNIILDYFNIEAVGVYTGPGHPADKIEALLKKMNKELRKLQENEPTLLEERTPEQIAAILAKEAEAATLKLARMKEGKDWKKIDPDKLQAALNKHVHKS